MTAFGEYADDETSSTMKMRDFKDATDLVAQPVAFKVRGGCEGGGKGYLGSTDTAFTISTTHDQQVAVPVAFPWQQGGTMPTPFSKDVSGSLIKNQTMAVAFTTEQTPKFNADCALTLTKQSPTGGGQPQCVATITDMRGHGDGSVSPAAWAKETANDFTPMVQTAMQVRRLLPTEAEALQGFPRDYTNIPWRGKPESPDGPRYKALGNSMAVPCMSWIGKRIQQVEEI